MDGTERVAAVVVLFEPDGAALGRLYGGLRGQVDGVWFVDNSAERLAGAWAVEYRWLGGNRGIAAAQNVGIQEALAAGFGRVLLLDQDSGLPAGTVDRLRAAEAELVGAGVKVAAVGPVFVDAKTKLPGKAHHHVWFRLRKPFVDLAGTVPVETDWLIASGCLIRAEVLARVGLMREEMFIDAVDMEWGMRARSLGLKSFVVPQAQIAHSVGDRFVRFMGVSVIQHDDVRTYYIARNWIYLLRVGSMGWRWRSGVLQHQAKFMVVHTITAERRWARVRLFWRAVWDGVVGRMGRYEG